MRIISVGLGLNLAAAAAAAAAAPEPVTFSGGFQAAAHREIATVGGGKAMVYSVLGSIQLRFGDAAPRPLSAECVGFDESGGSSPTTGTGRCLWRDADGDRLFVSLTTRGSENVYEVTGGTGKWTSAAGQLRTTFHYLPAPEGTFLLAESGIGRISTPIR